MNHRLSLLALTATLSIAASLRSQIVAYHDQSSASHQAQFNNLEPQGYRMIALTIYGTKSNLQYGAVWMKRSGLKFRAFHDKSESEYQAFINTWVPQGYTPKLLTATGSGLGERFAGVLELTNASPYLRHNLTQSEFRAETKLARDNGWRITTADVYGTNGTARYIVSYEKNPDLSQGYFISSGVSDFQTHFNAFEAGHYRPALVAFNKHDRFLSLWRQQDVGAWRAHHNMTSAEYQANAVGYKNQGLYPISIQGSGSGAGRRFAAVFAETDIPKKRSFSMTGQNVGQFLEFDNWVESWMKNRDARAASMAIVKDGRLVYTRGYRYAEPGYPAAQPDSRYRIASLVKPLTSIAVHQHYEKMPAKITPTDTMVSFLNPSSVFVQSTNNITVDHLLTHRGGWDRNKAPDPMFQDTTIATALSLSLPINKVDVFDYMSTTQPLEFTPGNSSVYSNYGFSLMGQILEQLNPGLSYEQIIQRDIFDPLQITRPSINTSLKGDRVPGEVRYHPKTPAIAQSVNSNSQPWVPAQYGAWNQENMDAHGSYVMAAPDLALVLAAFDLGAANPLLGQTETDNMWSPPAGFSTTLRGWFLRKVKDVNAKSVEMYAHNGKLWGSSTLVLHREDGISIVLFTNGDAGLSRNVEGQELSDLANKISLWPSHDLFDTVGLRPVRIKLKGSMTPYGSACGSSTSGLPQATGSGTPELGQTYSLDLQRVPAGLPTIALLGFNRAALDLGFIGAPGCVIHNDAIATLSTTTGRTGTAAVPLRVPMNYNLIGLHLYAQFVTIDASANRAGLSTSNGLDILIGGSR